MNISQVEGTLLQPRSIIAIYDLFQCPHFVTFSSVLPLLLGESCLLGPLCVDPRVLIATLRVLPQVSSRARATLLRCSPATSPL
jgi:hypothetical protein